MLRYRLALPLLWGHRLARLLAPSRQGFRILIFHDVPDDRFSVLEGLVRRVKEKYGVLTPEQAAAWLSGSVPPEYQRAYQRENRGEYRGRQPCLFSFDDGFFSNHRAATQVLDAHGVKGLFFVCPGLMDLTGENQRTAIARNIFNGRVKADGLPPDLRLMTWQEVADLDNRGHAIGAHGLTHRRLSVLSGEDLKREITAAGDRIKQALGVDPGWFAYAFGDIDSITPEAMEIISRRYGLCRSGVRGLNSVHTQGCGVTADVMDLKAPSSYLALVTEGGLDKRYIKARSRLQSYASSVPQQAASSPGETV